MYFLELVLLSYHSLAASNLELAPVFVSMSELEEAVTTREYRRKTSVLRTGPNAHTVYAGPYCTICPVQSLWMPRS